LPRLQRPLQVGDRIPDGPPGTAWSVVQHVERPHLLVLHSTTHVPAAALLARYPGSSKTEAIEAALRAHLAEDAVSRLRRLAGTVDIDDVSTAIRAHDRRS
jgi:hypothetical protein